MTISTPAGDGRSPDEPSRRERVSELIRSLVDTVDPPRNRDLLRSILRTATGLGGDDADRLDLKIASAALREMRDAYRMFAPYRGIPKVTIFGSARTRREDPLYAAARELAADLAADGWMVLTGAGPGIMAAGSEGAGPDRALGVNIRLPFEQIPTELIADERLVEMRYFFTRKLMLIKESQAFVALPGGFGTLDETFELLTLQQTGKAPPAPIVLLDTPAGSYWHGWLRFVADHVAHDRLISGPDRHLFTIHDDPAAATEEIRNFYRNYHSIRYVGDTLVIRMRGEPTDAEVADIETGFSDICVDGRIRRVEPLEPEVADDDQVDLPRIALRFDRASFGRLHLLIRHLNLLDSAPRDVPTPPINTAADG